MLDGIKMEEHALRPGPATLGVLLGECEVGTPRVVYWQGTGASAPGGGHGGSRPTDKGNGVAERGGVGDTEKTPGVITRGTRGTPRQAS